MLTADLYPYQDEAVDMILDLGYGLIAYEMGLGKTIIALAAVEELLAEPSINFALIVVPSGLKYQWAESIAKFTDVKSVRHRVKNETIMIPTREYCVVIDGTPSERRSQYRVIEENWPNYVICSYETVVSDFKQIYALGAEMVIVDEASAIKGFKAKRSKKIKELDPEFAVALTGTPVENRPEEVFSIMEFVCPGYLGTFWSFDKKYIVRNNFGGVKRYKNLDILHQKLSKVMSRKTRQDPDVAPYLPDVDTKEVYVDLDAKSWRLYQRIAADALKELQEGQMAGDFDIAAYYRGEASDMTTAGKVMARVLAMQMLCDHPRLLRQSAEKYAKDEGGSEYAYKLVSSGALDGVENSAKFDEVLVAIRNVLEVSDTNKVIVFSFFKEMGRMFKEALKDYESVIYNGDMSPGEKAAAKARFQQRPECRLFLASDAGGYGVDLPQANYLINYDQAESAGKMDQRNARHVRAGSKHEKVFILNYLCDGTIEERTFQRLAFKRKVGKAILDGGTTAPQGEIENDVDTLTDFLSVV